MKKKKKKGGKKNKGKCRMTLIFVMRRVSIPSECLRFEIIFNSTEQSLCADSQKSFPRHDLSLLFGHCRRNCARRNEGRENVRRRDFGSGE